MHVYLKSSQLFLVPSSGLGLQIAGAAGNDAGLLEERAVQRHRLRNTICDVTTPVKNIIRHDAKPTRTYM